MARTLAENPHREIAAAFPKPVNWNKIQACTQKSDEPVGENYNQFQIVFKENAGLLLAGGSSGGHFVYSWADPGSFSFS